MYHNQIERVLYKLDKRDTTALQLYFGGKTLKTISEILGKEIDFKTASMDSMSPDQQTHEIEWKIVSSNDWKRFKTDPDHFSVFKIGRETVEDEYDGESENALTETGRKMVELKLLAFRDKKRIGYVIIHGFINVEGNFQIEMFSAHPERIGLGRSSLVFFTNKLRTLKKLSRHVGGEIDLTVLTENEDAEEFWSKMRDEGIIVDY